MSTLSNKRLSALHVRPRCGVRHFPRKVKTRTLHLHHIHHRSACNVALAGHTLREARLHRLLVSSLCRLLSSFLCRPPPFLCCTRWPNKFGCEEEEPVSDVFAASRFSRELTHPRASLHGHVFLPVSERPLHSHFQPISHMTLGCSYHHENHNVTTLHHLHRHHTLRSAPPHPPTHAPSRRTAYRPTLTSRSSSV